MQFFKTTKLVTIKKLANQILIINVKDFEKVMNNWDINFLEETNPFNNEQNSFREEKSCVKIP